MKRKTYAIVGAGGFGREVMAYAMDMLSMTHSKDDFELVFVVEHGGRAAINGHRVLSPDDFFASDSEKLFNIAIADWRARERIAAEFVARGATPFTIRAINSYDGSNNSVAEGAIICPFVTITSNATIGRFFHANIYSYIAHDCKIGDFVTFAPSVHCNGGVIVEDYAYVGTGAVIRQGSEDRPIVIGRGAIVGMGAVVTKSVAPGSTVVGNPAAPLKRDPQ